MEFSTEADYDLAVENHIEQLVETHNQAMSNGRHYHKKWSKPLVRRRWESTWLLTSFLGIMFGWTLDIISREKARVGLNG